MPMTIVDKTMCEQIWLMLNSVDVADVNIAIAIIRQKFNYPTNEDIEVLLCIQHRIQQNMQLGNASRELIELEREIYEHLN